MEVKADKTKAEDIEYSICRKDELSEEAILQFDCGNSVLNDIFHKNTGAYTTRVYKDKASGKIIAFATYSASAILYHPSEKSQFQLPSAEIHEFALNNDYQHLQFESISDNRYTLGDDIFCNLIKHLTEINEKYISFSYILLYSVDTAVSFYERNLFRNFTEYMEPSKKLYTDGCTPMFLEL